MMANEELRKMLEWINQEMELGKSRAEIVDLLTGEDGNPKDIEKVIDAAIEYKKAKSSDTESGGESSFLMSIIFLVIGYALMNGLIYGAQEAYYWNDTKKCEAMEKRVKEIKEEINQIDKYASSRKDLSDKIEQLGTKIKQGYSTNFTQYEKMVEKYNAGLSEVKIYKEKYDNLAIEHDEIVDKYNELAEKAYSRWWLLPIPLPGKHTSF